MAGLSVAWRRCSGRCRHSRWCRCHRWSRCSRRRTSPAAPSRAPAPGSRPLPLPARRGGGTLLPWHVVGALVGRVLPWPGAAAAPPSPPSHGCPLRWRGKGKPQWGWWLGRLALCLPLAFEPWRRNGRAKSLCCPSLDCPGDRGGAASSFVRVGSQGCGAGVKEDPPPVRVRLAREHARSLGVRVAWLARLSHHAPPARCGSVDPPSGAGEGEKKRGEGENKG
jgi:hypothetical protein